MGVADVADRLPALGGARALRPLPGRRGRRQRGHLHRPARQARPHAGVLPHRGRRRRAHRGRRVRRTDARAREGQGRRADQRFALQRQQPGRPTVDPRHGLAFGAQVLRALRARPAVGRRGVRGTGRSRASRPNCRPANPPTCPRSRDEVRQYFADVRGRLCTSEHADTAMRYLLWTPRDRGVRLWAGSRILAPAAIATLPKWMRHMGGFDQPAAVDAAVTPMARAMVRAMSAATRGCFSRGSQAGAAHRRGARPPSGSR